MRYCFFVEDFFFVVSTFFPPKSCGSATGIGLRGCGIYQLFTRVLGYDTCDVMYFGIGVRLLGWQAAGKTVEEAGRF